MEAFLRWVRYPLCWTRLDSSGNTGLEYMSNLASFSPIKGDFGRPGAPMKAL
jgi:hypothetical protein